MADVELEPTEQPITNRTRVILQAINKLDSKHLDRLETTLNELQNVSEAVREIQRHLGLATVQAGINNTWRTAVIRALNQFLSHVDPNWKKNHQ